MAKQRNPNGLGSYKKKSDGRVAWVQGKNGKKREVTARNFPELQEKVKKVADMPIIKNKYTVADWFDKWLSTYILPLKAPATYNQYNDIYRVHIKPVIGESLIKNITSMDIQLIINKMHEKGLSVWTMKHARKILNGAFSKAVSGKDKLIAANPVVDIQIPNKQAKKRKVLNAHELMLLFRNLQNSRWFPCIRFMLHTGLRRGEALALKWSNIDMYNKRITVEESVSNFGKGDTKSRKVHYIPLSDIIIKDLNLQKYQLEKEINPILHDPKKAASDLVFPNESGVELKPGSLFTVVYRAAKKAGIHASPHMLRHTFVYNTRSILSLKEIQAILGHDESTTTLDLYGDIIEGSTDKTAGKMNEAFVQLENEVKKQDKKGRVVQFRRN